MSKRAILYARVSYDDRDNEGRNLAGQLEMCREYALSRGWRIVAELAEDDRGASGASFDLPELNKALDMARAGEFDVLVVRELDRFARGLAKQLVVESEFRQADVEIECVLGEYPPTPEGDLMKNVRAVIAEYERLKISERMTRGRRLKVQRGSVMMHGRAPFGYRIVVEADGKQMLEVNEPEAQIVRLIYTWYTEGDGEKGPMSIRGIAKRLDKMGMGVTRSTVGRILGCETYAGTWHYGKWGRKDKRRVRNPKEHLIAVEVPAIVSQETLEIARRRRKENKESGRYNRKNKYLMGGRITCGVCGGKMGGLPSTSTKGGKPCTRLYYRCHAAWTYGDYERQCSNRAYFPAAAVDAVIWDWLKEIITDPERLANGLEEHRIEQEKANEPLRARLAAVESLIATNRAQLERLLDLYLSGDFPKEMLEERKGRLETTVNTLEKEHASLVASLEASTLTDEQIKSIREVADKIKKGLEIAENDFDARRRMVEFLDVWTTLVIEDGEKVAHTRCRLPGTEATLSVSQNTCKPSRPGSRVRWPGHRWGRGVRSARRPRKSTPRRRGPSGRPAARR